MPLLNSRNLISDIGTRQNSVLLIHLLIGEGIREALKGGND